MLKYPKGLISATQYDKHQYQMRRSLKNIKWKKRALRWLLPEDFTGEVSIDTVDHEKFRLQNVPELYNPDENQPYQRGNISGFIVDDAVLWPSVGAIRLNSGELVIESFFSEQKRKTAKKTSRLKRYRLIEGREYVTSLGHVYGNYYHNYIDCMSKIYSLYHPRFKEIESIGVYIDSRFTSEDIELISYLLPSNAAIIEVDDTCRIKAKTYIHLPFLSSDRVGYSRWFDESGGFLPREYLEWYRNMVFRFYEIGEGHIRAKKKIYVTRRNANIRRLINENEVASYLKKHGFEIAALETMPIRDQVKLFAAARLVVAQHGGGLTNLLYSSDNTSVIEIMSSKDKIINYSLLSRSRGFNHKQIYCDGEDKNDDVYMPLDRLEEEIRKIT